MSKVKLLPCPFCGGEADLVEYMRKLDCKKFAVECRNIECPTLPCTEWHLDKEEAIKAWNIRKPMDDIVKLLEESKENNYRYTDSPNYLDGGYQVMKEAIEIVKEVGGSYD